MFIGCCVWLWCVHFFTHVIPLIVLAEGKVTFRLQASAEEFKDILRRMFPILSEEFTLLKCEPYGGKAGGGHLIPLEQYQSVADIKRQMHRGVLYVRLVSLVIKNHKSDK